MFFRKVLFAVFLTVFSSAVLSQSIIYHCLQNGKKLVSDQPCEEVGAKESRRVYTSEMPPVNTTQVLTNDEKWQGHYLRKRLNAADDEFLNQRQHDRAVAAQVKRDNEEGCKSLWREKERIIAQQRTYSNDHLNRRHREINDQIYRLNCGS